LSRHEGCAGDKRLADLAERLPHSTVKDASAEKKEEATEARPWQKMAKRLRRERAAENKSAAISLIGITACNHRLFGKEAAKNNNPSGPQRIQGEAIPQSR